MRLEIEPTLAAPYVADETLSENGVDSVEAKSALNQGIKAAQAGNRSQARVSLLRATEIDPRNESAWLWLASISEYPEELLGFLNHVLDINPKNERAVEWKAATHTLLSKTFVQRGIDAFQENQKEFAEDCFQSALDYNERNADAWIWMAAISDSNAVKVSLLENALVIDSQNESALSALESAKGSILKERLTEAKTAAVAGDNAEATRILDTLLATNPDSVEAWTMLSHLADGFDEKIRCFENILRIEPENVAAKAGRDSLLEIFGTAEAAANMESSTVVEEHQTEPTSEHYVHLTTEPAIDRSPTEELALPAGFTEDSFNSFTPQHEENENQTMDSPEEPFASFAEEITYAPEAEHEGVTEFVDAKDFFVPEYQDETHRDNDSDSDTDTDTDTDTDRVYADPQAETVMFSYDVGVTDEAPAMSPAEESSMLSDPVIPMPSGELPAIKVNDETEPASNVVEAEVVVARPEPEAHVCSFCGQTNDAQSISCQRCLSVLTLSDLELLLANQSADKLLVRQAVEDMERKRLSGQLDADQLITLGIGHLNLRNLQLGYSCLLEASKMDANNVVLGGQVNSLLIRLEEIRQQEEAHLKMPRGKSILVVDDSPTVRKLIAGKLEKCGHDVICASDGVEAMERLDHFIPDLILLDITMPRMDGYQVCKNIRSNNSTKDVPIVMISGKDGFFDKVRGRMAGTTGYITKPFGPETLMKAVEMYLSGEIPESDEV